jgi:hypothetical protein
VLAALLVLAVPILWSLPGTARREKVEVRAYWNRSTATADFLAPFVRFRGQWPARREVVRFARLVARVVPPQASIAVDGSRDSTWVRSLAYAVAPRLIVADADWVVFRIRSGAAEGVEEGRSWNVGEYWLVRR